MGRERQRMAPFKLGFVSSPGTKPGGNREDTMLLRKFAYVVLAAGIGLASSAQAEDWKVTGEFGWFGVGTAHQIDENHFYWVGEFSGTFFNDKGEELRRESLLTELRQRIRDVRQGPDGLLYLLTEENQAALLRLEPVEKVAQR